MDTDAGKDPETQAALQEQARCGCGTAARTKAGRMPALPGSRSQVD